VWHNGLCPTSGRGLGKAASVFRADAPVTETGASAAASAAVSAAANSTIR
jgi:hypothetical protein